MNKNLPNMLRLCNAVQAELKTDKEVVYGRG